VNNKGLLLALLLIPATWICFGQVPDDYYRTATGLTGNKLKVALHDIIDNHIRIPWESSKIYSWTVLYESDRDPQNFSNIILFYSGQSVPAEDSIGHHSWEREHVWARSHGDFDDIPLIDCDLHNVKPADQSFNGPSGKWYKDFDETETPFKTDGIVTECFSDKDSWEPRDEDKGDVARIMFYMDVRYEGTEDELDLVLSDEVNTAEKTIAGKVGYHGKLSTLLGWHHEDPVDDFEQRRNEVIYHHQNNRNPFIDHPEFADLIWGNNIISRPGSMLVLYPVPASDILNIIWNGKNPVRATLLNSGGGAEMEIEFSGFTKLDVTRCKPGIYFISVTDGENSEGKKVVVRP
jgi:endonuclease I